MAEKPIVVVFTANSNTGAETVKHLVDKYSDKVRIRCVVRHLEKARLIEHLDVEIVRGDITQPNFLGKVFDDNVNAAFWSTPSTQDRVDLTAKFLEACITYGVDYPILISVLDADANSIKFQRYMSAIEQICEAKKGTPVKKQLHDTGKQTLQPIILRTGFFYQNFYGSVQAMADGQLYYPLGTGGACTPMPHVDLDDIGQIIAKMLVEPEPYGGRTFNLIGEYQAGNQIAQTIGMSTGHRVAYEDVPPEVAVMAFMALGIPEFLAQDNVEMMQYFVNGNGQGIKSDVEQILGRPPTKFAKFCKTSLKPLLG
eukprot:m.17012 g.17012  ORF g.17012 m.17012 type:complete len:312 (-) comp10633_c0_seq1:86-1021(-)